jgi:hypothetical protein
MVGHYMAAWVTDARQTSNVDNLHSSEAHVGGAAPHQSLPEFAEGCRHAEARLE